MTGKDGLWQYKYLENNVGLFDLSSSDITWHNKPEFVFVKQWMSLDDIILYNLALNDGKHH